MVKNVLLLGRKGIVVEDVANNLEMDDIRLFGGTNISEFLGSLISLTGTKKMGLLAAKPNKDLALVIELIESGKVKFVIDRQYPLHEVAEALRYFGAGHARGKVVVTLDRGLKNE